MQSSFNFHKGIPRLSLLLFSSEVKEEFFLPRKENREASVSKAKSETVPLVALQNTEKEGVNPPALTKTEV